MKKKGAIELSFGMILSILMIGTIVAVATYAIVYFLNLGSATELSLFHQKFQESVDEVWASSITDKIVSFSLPRGITHVCFGNLTAQSWDPRFEEQYEDFQRYSSNFEKRTTNRFIYPTEKAGEFAYKQIRNIDLSRLPTKFECFVARDRKIEVRLVKDTFDPLVFVEKP